LSGDNTRVIEFVTPRLLLAAILVVIGLMVLYNGIHALLNS